jgi:hypothetical protein
MELNLICHQKCSFPDPDVFGTRTLIRNFCTDPDPSIKKQNNQDKTLFLNDMLFLNLRLILLYPRKEIRKETAKKPSQAAALNSLGVKKVLAPQNIP